MYAEPMKIQLGTIYINRTRKYLFPIIKQYGSALTDVINSLFKLGVGVGDMIVNRCGIRHEKHLFILCDAKYDPVAFDAHLHWLRENQAYEDDYVFDPVHEGRLHMIVIKIPEEYIESFKRFMESNFSKMYSQEDIKKFFNYTGKDKAQQKLYESISKVLIHDHNYKLEFAKQIQKEFFLPKFSHNEIENSQEFELPITLQEEFFNYRGE